MHLPTPRPTHPDATFMLDYPPHSTRRAPARLLASLCVLLAALAGPSTAPVGARAADDPCASGLVARIQSTYQALKSFQGHFSQLDRQTDGRRMEATGSVSYLKPGRMRWEYAPPNEQLLVTDGATVWLYDPILDNVTVQPLSGLTQGTPLAFLLGAGNLQQDFACRPFSQPPPADGLDYVELVPRQPIPALAYIQLGAQVRSGRIAALRMVDSQGNLREVRFADLRTDVPLKPQAFSFDVQPGMEVIRKDEG
jgi:outer membrane lipoprotein carrier protein